MRLDHPALASASGTLAVLAVVLAPAAAFGQLPAGVSPGWYAVPGLGLTAEYDSNVFGAATGRRDDVLFRVSPSLTLGYVSEPLTVLGRYILGAEVYADNSDLDGINRQVATLDARYRPTRRWWLGLLGSYVQSDSVTGLAAPGTRLPAVAEEPRLRDAEVPAGPEPDTELTPIPSAATRRQETTQIVASPRAAYEIDRLTSVSGSYTFRLSDEEGRPTDTEHAVRLGVRRRLTPVDRATLNYIFRYFESDDVTGGDDTTSSHAVTVGYGRRLTPLTDVSAEVGPRFEDEGDVGFEARAALLHRFRTATLALSYAHTQSIVSGRGGAQTVDILAMELEWTPLRELTLGLVPGVGYYQEATGDRGDRDTLVYGVTATATYRLTEWLSIRAAYVFRYEDEQDGDEFPRHVVSLGVAMSYPFRLR